MCIAIIQCFFKGPCYGDCEMASMSRFMGFPVFAWPIGWPSEVFSSLVFLEGCSLYCCHSLPTQKPAFWRFCGITEMSCYVLSDRINLTGNSIMQTCFHLFRQVFSSMDHRWPVLYLLGVLESPIWKSLNFFRCLFIIAVKSGRYYSWDAVLFLSDKQLCPGFFCFTQWGY